MVFVFLLSRIKKHLKIHLIGHFEINYIGLLANQNQTLEHRTQRQAISLPGIFRVFCSTLYHFQRGMNQIYEVSSCGSKDPSEQPYGMIRTFYIAAEEVEWDYAPNKNWEFEKQHSDGGWERYTTGEAAAESLGWGLTCSVDVCQMWKLKMPWFCLPSSGRQEILFRGTKA